MLISRTWLQSYFETELPDAHTIAETLLLHSFEIEEVYEKNNDWIIDIDVLPNRAHDCLSYIGIAREYAMLTGAILTTNRYLQKITPDENLEKVSVTVQSQNCLRYCAIKISEIKVGTSPEWMVRYLTSMGQKSINTVVDATNIIMFETGQPLHAFDADKIVGEIILRQAYEGETMTILGGEVLELQTTDLVICDNEGILALAGVKGGIKAEVTNATKNIILEAGNFNPLSTRITARRVKILTDSSKRFENGISSEIAPLAAESFISLMQSLHSEKINKSKLSDYYPKEEIVKEISVSHEKIETILGLKISPTEVKEIFKRLSFPCSEKNNIYTVIIPYYRLDLNIPEDLIEEVGRVYGYYKIPSQSLDSISFSPRVHHLTFLENSIKNFLTEKGFDELKNYAFVNKGEIELLNPLASDKKALRDDVKKSFHDSLIKNSQKADYFGKDQTKLFEIAREYHADREDIVCAISIINKDKKAKKQYGIEEEQLEKLVQELETMLGMSLNTTIDDTVVWFSVSNLQSPDEVREYGKVFKEKSYEDDAVFHSVSPYPYTTRDVSFWTDQKDSEQLFKNAIENTKTRYLQKIYLFDTFEKEGRVSYAYSLIFQSLDKTLTDVEVEEDMQKIIQILEDQGCELR